MYQIGSKTINIQVTDSSVSVPEAGGFFGGSIDNIIDGLASTPAETVILTVLAVVVPICILAILLSRLHHNKLLSKVLLGFAPVAAALAIVAAPFLTLAAPNTSLLGDTKISLTIDKAKSLTADGAATVQFSKGAASHVDVYASVDEADNFDGNLGANIGVSTKHTGDSSNSVDLSTTNNLIYTTGPVEAGETTDFNLTVDITKDLPVGNYQGTVNYFGDFVPDTAEVSFWCYPRTINPIDPLPEGVMEGRDDYGGYMIGVSRTYNVGDSFEFVTPNELGLFGGECNLVEWTVNIGGTDHQMFGDWDNSVEQNDIDESLLLPKYIMDGALPGSRANIAKMPTTFTNPQPNPSTQPWYDRCWLKPYNDADYCYNPATGYLGWRENAYQPWASEWFLWSEQYRQQNNATAVFDGMKIIWQIIPNAM